MALQYTAICKAVKMTTSYEPRCEKNGLQGFRPGPTQTRLHRKMTGGLKFCIYVEEKLYYPYSENKGADQLRGFAYAKSQFSHDGAHMKKWDV